MGLYKPDEENFADYDASLLIKGKTNGQIMFISPKEEGLYVLRLIRNDTIELASTAFRVISEKEKSSPSIEPVSANSEPGSPKSRTSIVRGRITAALEQTREVKPSSNAVSAS